ncbi:hypothetical protein Tsubulata_049915, partial [Turnera subulata]
MEEIESLAGKKRTVEINGKLVEVLQLKGVDEWADIIMTSKRGNDLKLHLYLKDVYIYGFFGGKKGCKQDRL